MTMKKRILVHLQDSELNIGKLKELLEVKYPTIKRSTIRGRLSELKKLEYVSQNEQTENWSITELGKQQINGGSN